MLIKKKHNVRIKLHMQCQQVPEIQNLVEHLLLAILS